MYVTIVPLWISCCRGHYSGLQALELYRTTGCFSPLADYIAFAYTMKASLERETFPIDPAGFPVALFPKYIVSLVIGTYI